MRQKLYLQEYGLVFISDDTIDNNDKDKSKKNAENKNKPANKQDGVATADLVTPEAAEILRRTEGTLGKKLGLVSETVHLILSMCILNCCPFLS